MRETGKKAQDAISNPAATKPKHPSKEKPIELDSTPDEEPVQREPIGQILVSSGLIAREQLETALAEQEHKPAYLGVILMRHKWIDERDLYHQLALQRGVEFFDVRDVEIPFGVVDKIPKETALALGVLPVECRDGVLKVAMEDPFNEEVLEKLREQVSEKIEPGFTTRSDLHFGLNRAYNNFVRSSSMVRDFYDGFAYLIEQPRFDSNRLIDLTLALADLLGASDIHLTFCEHEMRVALRIDGALHNIPIPTRRISPDHMTQLRNALKIRGGLDPSKKGIPQDGRLDTISERDAIYALISCMPLVNGEKMVLRIIGQLKRRIFKHLGLSDSDTRRISAILRRPYGLIVVSGPNGSGKTTTLYAMLDKIPASTKSVVTIENPVEARISYANQVQIDRNGTLSFDRGLKALLQQDSDIIMIGEMRDRETAVVAVEAAITGHLILSSVQIDNAAGVILWLIDIGVEALALANALTLVVVQRLVPRLCDACRKTHLESAALAKELQIGGRPTLYTASGCQKCYYTGRSGRVALFETLYGNDRIRDVLTDKPSLTAISKASRDSGGRSFREDAIEKCLKGWLDPEDVLIYT